MRITEKTLDTGLELALNDLKKNLDGLGEAGATLNKTEILLKAREAVKSGKIDLLTAGMIEGRVNKGVSLSKAHRAALGLVDGAKIEGLNEPAASSVEARMGGEKTPVKINMGTGSPAPQNPIVAEMNRGKTLLHSFQQPDNSIMTVTGDEILKRCQVLVREGKMDLMKSGDLERAVNSGAVIRPEILRELFT